MIKVATRVGLLVAAAMVAGPVGTAAAQTPAEAAPRAVEVARTTTIPRCTTFVDATGGDAGTAQSPHRTIGAAVAAASPGAVICVAEGTYAEQLKPGTKTFTLAGGFKRGSRFTIRDSAAFVTKAQGAGTGAFFFVKDDGPNGGATAIDGFEITGYEQAIVRLFYEPQQFDVTNNHIHDNVCKDPTMVGAGFALDNVSGTIKGNVIVHNACGRGGAGFVNDGTNKNSVSFENNLVDSNAGTDPDSSHGGAFYGGANRLRLVGNLFTNNSVTQWGAGVWIGAFVEGGQVVNATLAWNVYRGNRAGNKGGGFFCDEGAICISDHEVYEGNCGGNIYLDSGGDKSRTIATFDHLTNTGALDADCKAPGPGVIVEAANNRTDAYSFTNAVFKGNAKGRDFVTGCSEECKGANVKVNVTRSTVQTDYHDGGIKVTFGDGIVPPSDQPAASQPEETTATPAPEPLSPPPAPVAASPAREPVPDDDDPPAEGARVTPAAAQGARHADGEVSSKEAFDEAKELGTVDAWNAFLANYPKGFHADLARAYLKKLGATASPPPPTPSVATPPASPAPAPAPAAEVEAPASTAPSASTTITAAPDAAASPLPPTDPRAPAIARGASYMGFPERFNRFYTDPTWRLTRTIFVSPDGKGDGATRETPMAVKPALDAAKPGTGIYFVRGKYTGGYELDQDHSGTYDDPIVLYGERNADGSIGVSVSCDSGSRKTCFNFEGAEYIAVDGFELVGGRYGVRAVGSGYPASQHSRGIASINNIGHDQERDPFFSGAADWAVWERNVAYGAKAGDGHGMYLSNGGDWNIARFNETFDNVSSDFQINADPASTCKEVDIPFNDPRCDAYAGTGEGGQGASDYFLVDANYFHHGKASGPNFTSVRKSVIRNNIFGIYPRHNTSFWQETDNPKLGASDNKIINNLFVTTSGRQAVQFIASSTRNVFANNVLLGVNIAGRGATANPSAVLMEVDGTTAANVYVGNLYVGGKLEGRAPSAQETARADFSAAWFAKFPLALNHDPNDFAATASAPFRKRGVPSPEAPNDRNGTPRPARADLGPIEAP